MLAGEAADAAAPPSPSGRHQSGMISSVSGRAADALVHRSERGEVRLWLAAPRVVVVKYVGYTDAACVDFLASAFESLVGRRQEGVQLFVDCEEQTGYEMPFPGRIAQWARAIHPRLRTVCILVCSRIVAFGVAVANVVAGAHATTVGTREEFSARLAASVRESPSDDAA